jgi:hypothetical protein
MEILATVCSAAGHKKCKENAILFDSAFFV